MDQTRAVQPAAMAGVRPCHSASPPAPRLRRLRCSVQKLETEPTRYIPNSVASTLWTKPRPRRTRLASRERNVALSRSIYEALAVSADVARLVARFGRSDRSALRQSERTGRPFTASR